MLKFLETQEQPVLKKQTSKSSLKKFLSKESVDGKTVVGDNDSQPSEV